jgi:hypothetical protein
VVVLLDRLNQRLVRAQLDLPELRAPTSFFPICVAAIAVPASATTNAAQATTMAGLGFPTNRPIRCSFPERGGRRASRRTYPERTT